MRESQVEKHLIARVEETGGFTRKVQWIAGRGAPDRLVGWPKCAGTYNWSLPGSLMPRSARHVLVETKRPTKSAEAHQAREHEHLRAIGFDVRVLDTIEAVDRFILEMTA